MHRSSDGCGLVVLADGCQAGFAAGAVAGLAARGAHWTSAWAAGLGAHVALLALLGEADEAERRWRRWADSGAVLLRSRIAHAREALSSFGGVEVAPDPWRLDGWLDAPTLRDHLEPEMADIPARLHRRGCRCWVSVFDTVAGTVEAVELGAQDAAAAGATLAAAASFAGGWGPASNGAWGGVAAAGAAWPSPLAELELDVVCGFPVPAVRRPTEAVSLFELVQRRDEMTAAASVVRELGARRRLATRLVVPEAGAYAAWSGRDGADLGVEYPLPWEHNGALLGQVIAYGRDTGERAGGARG